MLRSRLFHALAPACAALLAVPTAAHALSAMATQALCSDPQKGTGNAEEARKQAAAGDAAFAQRKDVAKAEEGVKAYEASLAADPNQPAVRIKVARLYYLLADGYWRLEGDAKEDAMVEGFLKGMTHAGAALGLVNPALKRKLCSGAKPEEVAAAMDKTAVEPMYWFSTHLGKYGLAKDIVEVLTHKDLIFAVMTTLQKLEPAFFYHAPDRYLGGYYTKVPFPDGDPARAFAQFRESLRGSPNYLATYNLFAEMYAVKVKSRVDPRAAQCLPNAKPVAADQPAPKVHPCRSLFEKLLRHVLDAKADVIPEIEAEQLVEKKKAAKLMEEIDTFFPQGQ